MNLFGLFFAITSLALTWGSEPTVPEMVKYIDHIMTEHTACRVVNALVREFHGLIDDSTLITARHSLAKGNMYAVLQHYTNSFPEDLYYAVDVSKETIFNFILDKLAFTDLTDIFDAVFSYDAKEHVGSSHNFTEAQLVAAKKKLGNIGADLLGGFLPFFDKKKQKTITSVLDFIFAEEAQNLFFLVNSFPLFADSDRLITMRKHIESN